VSKLWEEVLKLRAFVRFHRALDFLLEHSEALAQGMFFRTADLLNAEVDLSFWDTTTLYCEIDDEDDEGEVWEDQTPPALRMRGHYQEGRDGNPRGGPHPAGEGGRCRHGGAPAPLCGLPPSRRGGAGARPS
jgi:hypothetical protein